MHNTVSSLYNMKLLDELSKKSSSIHSVHPVIKLLTTLVYLIIIISFNQYEVSSLLPFIIYPVIIMSLADIPTMPILRRLLLVEPLIIGIGILNPFFDNVMVEFMGFNISRGWFTFGAIIFKGGLTVTSGLLLVATTGIENLSKALRFLKVPKVFVLQLLLTYRYISVLLEEVSRMLRAYSMRAPNQKGIHGSVWASFAGQLILRTYERGQRLYQAMTLRGFDGEYYTGNIQKFRVNDYMYFIGWSLFFILARLCNIPVLIGIVFTG